MIKNRCSNAQATFEIGVWTHCIVGYSLPCSVFCCILYISANVKGQTGILHTVHSIHTAYYRNSMSSIVVFYSEHNQI